MMPKFRVWDKENDRMLIPGEDSDCITLEIDENGINVYDMEHPSAEKGYDLAHLDCELMQSTGLKDKNGTEIYEGDIIDRGYHNMHTFHQIGVVEFGEGGDSDGWAHGEWFGWITDNETSLADVYKESTILGNIYENPELLEDN